MLCWLCTPHHSEHTTYLKQDMNSIQQLDQSWFYENDIIANPREKGLYFPSKLSKRLKETYTKPLPHTVISTGTPKPTEANQISIIPQTFLLPRTLWMVSITRTIISSIIIHCLPCHALLWSIEICVHRPRKEDEPPPSYLSQLSNKSQWECDWS